MSTRPDDIPQDVWDVALRVWAELLTADHVGDPEVALRDVDEIARAILAVKAEERERAALIAEEFGQYQVSYEIAAAIRKRGEA